MKLVIVRKNSVNHPVFVNEETTFFLEDSESEFSEDLERRIVELGFFPDVERMDSSLEDSVSLKTKHLSDFNHALLDCPTAESLSETCMAFARKFDCTELQFFRNVKDFLKRKDFRYHLLIPICSKKEEYGILVAKGKSFDFLTLSLVADSVTLKIQELLFRETPVNGSLEAHDSEGLSTPVVLCGVDGNVVKYLDNNLIIQSEFNDIKNTCRIHKPGVILVREDPLISIGDIGKVAFDLRNMYATRDAEMFFFSENFRKSDIKFIESMGRAIVVSPALIDNVDFQVHLVHLAKKQNRPLSPVYEVMNNALVTIHENLKNDFDSRDFCRSLGVSRSYLVNLFKYFFGMTVNEYRNVVRIHEAEKLFRTTDLKESEVMALCGFATYSVFSMNFLKYSGCRPSEFMAGKR